MPQSWLMIWCLCLSIQSAIHWEVGWVYLALLHEGLKDVLRCVHVMDGISANILEALKKLATVFTNIGLNNKLHNDTALTQKMPTHCSTVQDIAELFIKPALDVTLVPYSNDRVVVTKCRVLLAKIEMDTAHDGYPIYLSLRLSWNLLPPSV